MNAINTPITKRSLRKHQPTVLVLGGYGFIGRHIVSALESLNARVLIGTRRKKSAFSAKNERHIALHKLGNNNSWEDWLCGVDVIVNAVGILRQRHGETYDEVHHQAVKKLANACAKRDIRLIHISALGLNNIVKSRFLTSKLLGEQALVKSKADWHLIRPSLVDGDGGYGARWFRKVAQWPIHFIPSNARANIAPIFASDLGKATAAIALGNNTTDFARNSDRIYELGGQTMTLERYLNTLRLRQKSNKAFCIRVPAIACRALSHLCDLFHLTPFSFGHYELLKHANEPEKNRLTELLNSWSEMNRATIELLRASALWQYRMCETYKLQAKYPTAI